jgi:tetratricopeptide (TPR) repeat protein
LVEKAKVLYADQQQMEAQEVFLDALQTLPSPRQPVVSEAEQQAFATFFSRYVESTQSPDECSRLLADTKALVHSHPEFASVEYYSAACCANRGRFIEFFDLFFHAFQSRPDCFLNWKTQGVMHLRLFEASSSEERREIHRQAAVRCLKAAFTRQPQDSTVLVKLAFLLPPHEKVDLLKSVTAELIRLEAPIRRSDCFFLIQQAMEAGELEVAKQLLDKARSWYEYSRTINELSDQLAGVHKQGTVGK